MLWVGLLILISLNNVTISSPQAMSSITTTTTAATTTTTTILSPLRHSATHYQRTLLYPSKPSFKSHRPTTRIQVSYPRNQSTSTSTIKPISKPSQETIFFDGGAHYGDLIANLLLGFTLLWLPLTLAAVSRAFFLRYRFTNLRVTVISGFTGQDRSDFSYKVIKDVQVVPRFIGEWGDIIITLQNGTKVDLRSVPKFREIAKYCLSMSTAEKPVVLNQTGPKGF